MADVPHAQADQITCSELAVQTKIKKRKFTYAMAKLKPYADGPNILELQRGLLADDLPFIPWNLDWGIGCCVHNELLEVEEGTTVDRLCK